MRNSCTAFARQAQNVSFYLVWAFTISALRGCLLTEDPTTSEEAERLIFFLYWKQKLVNQFCSFVFRLTNSWNLSHPSEDVHACATQACLDVLVWPLSVQVVCLWLFLERADTDVQNKSKEWDSAREIFSVQEKYCTSAGLTQYFWPKPLKSVAAFECLEGWCLSKQPQAAAVVCSLSCLFAFIELPKHVRGPTKAVCFVAALILQSYVIRVP